MLGITFITLALVLLQVAAHPPNYTLNDGDEAIEVQSDIEAGGKLYQGDIVLSDEQREALRTRKAYDQEKARWKDGTDGYPLVPYMFKESMNEDAIQAAFEHWEEATCIKFEEYQNTDEPHLQFYIGSGCYSMIGMVYWKRDSNGQSDAENGQYGQEISIAEYCNKGDTIIHELGHAIGFWHEQSRSDRDNYITILEENIKDGKAKYFGKEADNNYGVPYDYSSNMHYRMAMFSKNDLPTIVTLDPMDQELIRSSYGLSHRDKLLANRMYNCIGKWLEKCDLSSDPCLNDGYTGKDCACVCPPGTSGSNCENIDDDYYAALRNPLSEKIYTEKSITIVTPMYAGTKFTKWIVPPTCKIAKVTFTSASLSSTCANQYLMVRTEPEDLAGQKMCSEGVSAGLTVTSNTGIIITMINKNNYDWEKTLWAADVTFENIPGCPAPAPPTDPPTGASTETPTEPPTDAPVATTLECTKRAEMQHLQKGESVTITSPNCPSEYGPAICTWKIRAAVKKTKVSITCDDFSLNDNDSLIINKNAFTKDSTVSARKLNIRFRSKKITSGPGFRCTVIAN